MAVVATDPAIAQVIAPTNSTLARWLDLNPGQEFVLGARRGQLRIGDFSEAGRVRLCVTSGMTPASNNVGARVVADDHQIVIPVGGCRDIQGAPITVMPAHPLGGKQRVKVVYSFLG